ncbi:MAG: tripartite tricarboxylate transporter TctB family protein [Burkholderiaceae bacterium]
MTAPDSSTAAGAAGISRRSVEMAVAAVLFLLGAVVAVASWQLGAGWRDDGPGAGYFPFYIGLLICVPSALVFVAALRGEHDDDVFVTYAQLRLVMTVLLPTLGFVVGVQLLGLYVGSVLFIAAFMVAVGRYPLLRSTVIALGFAALMFLTFEVWFKVPLYKGMFNLLAFLGY